MATDCPRCGLVNPANASRCDCGYDLAGRPPLGASRTGLRALFLSLEGRIGRRTYWQKFFLPWMLIYVTLLFLDGRWDTLDESRTVGLWSGIFWLISLYPSIAVGVKRCHDRDRSGWFLALEVVPIVNLWVFVELAFLEGTAGPNRYGLPERRMA